MGNCCTSVENKNFELSDDRSFIIRDFDYIISTINPFFSYNLRMIEEVERRFFLENVSLFEFIDIWLTGFLNLQVKKTYIYCKQDLDKLFNDEQVSEIVFLNLLLLILSPSQNSYFKKEYICYLIINKYFSKDIKNFTLLINSVSELISICVKISISFIFVFFIFDTENVDDLKELFISSSISINNGGYSISNNLIKHNSSYKLNIDNGAEISTIDREKSFNNLTNYNNKFNNEDECFYSKNEVKVLFFDKNKPFFNIESDKEISIFPHSNFIKNMNTLSLHFFKVISMNYGIKTHSSYEKYIDFITGYSLKKLLFKQTDFSKIQEEEIKLIVQDIIDILNVWKLFDLMFK